MIDTVSFLLCHRIKEVKNTTSFLCHRHYTLHPSNQCRISIGMLLVNPKCYARQVGGEGVTLRRDAGCHNDNVSESEQDGNESYLLYRNSAESF